ncbi:hypothetical protein ACJJTC_000302 [Scirpophaga incertulas]
MSGLKKMTLRVQSSEGTARVEVLDTDATAQLFERVYEALHLTTFGFALHKDRQRKEEILSSKSRQLRDYGLQHGDMIYLSPVNGAVLFEQPSSSEANNKPFGEPVKAGPSVQVPTKSTSSAVTIEEDEVDLELYQMPGTIQRQRDEKLCRHNSNGCCVHCSPLEPWDENYLKEHNIKHISFHSYQRKMTSGKFVALEEMSFKIKPGCRDHPPWPRGVCSACQPRAVTLTRQVYRHVDNVLVEHPAIVERFLAYWRATGHQRIGFLYGRYEVHPDVPLGIRARVAAVYEPPQSSSRDHVALAEAEGGSDSAAELLEAVASRLRLRRVGWIFTDLLPDDSANGTVRCLRGAETHFLSAQECIMAGHFQNQHPNACRAATAGYYGSKHVTVLATGDSQNRVHLEGYQVSQQAAAMVRDGVLLPTRDAPDLGYVRECSDKQYVPDVYYKERDAYGNDVCVRAQRLPVAYLVVDVPAGVAAAPAPTFCPRAAFPPAHRPLSNHLQTLKALHDHITISQNFLEAMSDLHVLVYLGTNEALPLSIDALAPLLDAVRDRDEAAALRWAAEPDPATLLQLAKAAAEGGDGAHRAHTNSAGSGSSSGAPGSLWTCTFCTFHNEPRRDACDMCAMPRMNAM